MPDRQWELLLADNLLKHSFPGKLIDSAFSIGRSGELRVMEHDQHTVGCNVYVCNQLASSRVQLTCLNTVRSSFASFFEGLPGILGYWSVLCVSRDLTIGSGGLDVSGNPDVKQNSIYPTMTPALGHLQIRLGDVAVVRRLAKVKVELIELEIWSLQDGGKGGGGVGRGGWRQCRGGEEGFIWKMGRWRDGMLHVFNHDGRFSWILK